jgi:hypothetical protein
MISAKVATRLDIHEGPDSKEDRRNPETQAPRGTPQLRARAEGRLKEMLRVGESLLAVIYVDDEGNEIVRVSRGEASNA